MITDARTTNTNVWLKEWLRWILGAVLTAAMLPHTLTAQTPRNLSDDQLISSANTSFSAGDYLQASILYFAYMERNPDAMNTAGGFKEDVLSAYWYSRGQVTDAINQTYQLRNQVAQLQAQAQKGQGTVTSGLGPPRKPKPRVPVPPPSRPSRRPPGRRRAAASATTRW